MTTDIAKYSIGRLRPHFIDVCRPLWRGTVFTLENPIVCSDNNHFRYITDFECTSDYPESKKRDGRLSFMSGHSSFAAFCLVYLVVSPQKSLKIEFNWLFDAFPFRSTSRWGSSGQPSGLWGLYINVFWFISWYTPGFQGFPTINTTGVMSS